MGILYLPPNIRDSNVPESNCFNYGGQLAVGQPPTVLIDGYHYAQLILTPKRHATPTSGAQHLFVHCYLATQNPAMT